MRYPRANAYRLRRHIRPSGVGRGQRSSAEVETHTVTATATDNAGNVGSSSATYTVFAWTLKGFYQPVDMNAVYNVVKNGSSVPRDPGALHTPVAVAATPSA